MMQIINFKTKKALYELNEKLIWYEFAYGFMKSFILSS